jgi:hypothetical protein
MNDVTTAGDFVLDLEEIEILSASINCWTDT